MNFFGVTFGQMFSSCVFIVDATITIYISTPPFKKTVLMLRVACLHKKTFAFRVSRQATLAELLTSLFPYRDQKVPTYRTL